MPLSSLYYLDVYAFGYFCHRDSNRNIIKYLHYINSRWINYIFIELIAILFATHLKHSSFWHLAVAKPMPNDLVHAMLWQPLFDLSLSLTVSVCKLWYLWFLYFLHGYYKQLTKYPQMNIGQNLSKYGCHASMCKIAIQEKMNKMERDRPGW